MRIPIRTMDENGQAEQVQTPRKKLFLASDIILKFLITDDDATDTLILCKNTMFHFTTTDFCVYEALASIKTYDDFKLNKLAKFFEVVQIVSYQNVNGREKPLLTHERVDELRKIALSNRPA